MYRTTQRNISTNEYEANKWTIMIVYHLYVFSVVFGEFS